jgi:hypothetical protein
MIMNELPLSKFAPFSKDDACYQHEVSNKLKEIKVECSNCIYLGEHIDQPVIEGLDLAVQPEMYTCNILEGYCSAVSTHGLCRFFTNIHEIEDTEETTTKEEISSTEDMSIALQKLDFTNTDIIQSIQNLRDQFIND